MVIQKARQFFHRSKASKRASLNDFYASLYPEEVRYALAHKAAMLGKPELLSLLGRFPYEAVYLVTKALSAEHDEQRFYLERLTRIYSRPEYHLDDLREYLHTQIKALPDGTALAGTKLLQISRAGSDHWQEAFRNLAERSYVDDHLALPCIVAYTPMIGYHHFVRIFSQNSLGKLQLLVPEWMLNSEDERMGYEISLGVEATVRSQVKHECLYGTWVCLHTECRMKHRFCQDAIFIDDTINTGTTSNKLQSFWHSSYGLQIPNERIRVITDLRNSLTSNLPLRKVATKDTDNASHERN